MRWLLLTLVLAGCASGSPAQRACEREAESDPLVKDLEMKGAGSPQFLRDHLEETAQAKKSATYRCLQRTGVIRPGGVERQKPI